MKKNKSIATKSFKVSLDADASFAVNNFWVSSAQELRAEFDLSKK